MAETKIIKAVFGSTRSIITQPRYTSDYGQVIEVVGVNLPEYFETYFANSPNDKAKKVLGHNGRVTIPQEYTANPGYVYAWVMVHDDITDGRAMYTIKVPIKKRAEPTDEEPLPEEVDIISQAIGALNDAVERTSASAQTASDKASEASDSATASAQSATASAESAGRSAESAQSAFESATASAESALASAQSASASAESAHDSADSASQSAQSADRAEQAAGQSGYMAFWIDSNGDLIYERTSNVDVDFRLVDGDLILEAV